MYTKGVHAAGASAGPGPGAGMPPQDEANHTQEAKAEKGPADAGAVDAEYTVVDDEK
jgi:hypothetical protein